MPERDQMSDLPLPPLEHVFRPEFLALRDDVKRVERDLAVMNDRQALVQTDLDGIRSDLRDIKGELKNMRGWKQFLLTGGIGVGWGVVQGIFHLFGVGSAP
jgi:hypothetical protein